MEKDIKNIISDSLKIKGGENRENRIEENNSTRITYRGDSRENISINSGIGGCARVYSNGGWGFSSFNDIYQSKNKMAEAIKKVALFAGHDIRGGILVAFGGAGGQHACRLANQLGIKQVLLHPLAGVLSAHGLLHKILITK